MAKEGFCTNIVGKAKEETKNYIVRDRKQPGCKVTGFLGDAPKQGEWFKDTVTQISVSDGESVKLTETQARELRSRGTYKESYYTDSYGNKVSSGKKTHDPRFDIYEER